jgi:hypothetical protein
MTRVILDIPPEVERTLRERAAQNGQTLEVYLQQIAEREARDGSRAPPTSAPHSEATLDQILEPFRQSFEESGMTDDELAALVEEVREEIWREKQQGPKAP